MRLFFALPLPGAVRRELAALETDLGKARWVPEHQLHLTLRFVGEQEPAVADALVAAVEARRAADPWTPLELRVRGVGLFGSPRRPRVLWAAVEPLEALAALAAELEEVVQSVGLEPERRPFAAHVTLARLGRADPAALQRFLKAHAALETDPFRPKEVVLYESRRSSEGVVHQPVERWRL